MILIFTSANIASMNIARKLIEKHGFAKSPDKDNEWQRENVLLIDTGAPTVLDVPTDFKTDCLIVLSSHKSRMPGEMLTAHTPGNWGKAEMGGEPRTLNIAHAPMLKRIIQELDASCRAHGLNWPVLLEADHHGPTCSVPIMFVEIGNGENEWKNDKAAEVVAEAVVTAVFGKSKKYGAISLKPATGSEMPEGVFGVGGGHYAHSFTKLMLKTDIAVGHIAPKYILDELDEEMFAQAIRKNVGGVAKVAMLRDETNAKQKEKVSALAERFGLVVEMF